ncbi:MAG: flagellar hook protein FlgE [Sulfuricella sp.]|nr:flagellar hook protein FlgE [Sulfuricella sp.]
MGFQQGLSGLNGASKSLDVIGNNVANAGTAGFKGAQAQFADVFAASLNGSGGTLIGIGTKLAAAPQQFTQGNITTSSNPLDVAINGNGFFRMSSNGVASYTRNGQFQMDKNGYIVNSAGMHLTGYDVDAAGNISATNPVDIQLTAAKQSVIPSPTTKVGAGVNLDSRDTVPVPVFNPNDSTSFNKSTPVNVYDSLGNSHVLLTYYVKDAVPNTWNVYATVDGASVTVLPAKVGQVTFNSSGMLTTAMPLGPMSVALANGAATPQLIDLNLTGTTQFGADFSINSLSQDGFTSGNLAGFNISADGTILGRYTNGQSRVLGQVILANFTNPQGLQSLGNNQWAETSESGPVLIGAAGTGKFGLMQSGATEDSNVDLTAELVNMITAQRIYQANAQTIKTQDSIMQTIVNLR